MYKVSYYTGSGTLITFKCFPNLNEAIKFSVDRPTGSVLEIKHYADENKKEDRT